MTIIIINRWPPSYCHYNACIAAGIILSPVLERFQSMPLFLRADFKVGGRNSSFNVSYCVKAMMHVKRKLSVSDVLEKKLKIDLHCT